MNENEKKAIRVHNKEFAQWWGDRSPRQAFVECPRADWLVEWLVELGFAAHCVLVAGRLVERHRNLLSTGKRSIAAIFEEALQKAWTASWNSKAAEWNRDAADSAASEEGRRNLRDLHALIYWNDVEQVLCSLARQNRERNDSNL